MVALYIQTVLGLITPNWWWYGIKYTVSTYSYSVNIKQHISAIHKLPYCTRISRIFPCIFVLSPVPAPAPVVVRRIVAAIKEFISFEAFSSFSYGHKNVIIGPAVWTSWMSQPLHQLSRVRELRCVRAVAQWAQRAQRATIVLVWSKTSRLYDWNRVCYDIPT